MNFYVTAEHTLADIQNYFPDSQVTVLNENKPLNPYDFDKITKGK
jgi:hypothetical protein